MEYSELGKLSSLLGSFGLGALIGGGIIYLFIKNYIPSYLTEKAKNLATKEDIEGITDKVETVKSSYSRLLEEVRSNNQLKIAAIEREKTLKKEVYMEAVEAITKAQNMVVNFSNLNFSEEIITAEFSAEEGKIAKVQIVGSGETVKAVTKIMSSIGAAVLSLMLGRSSLMQRKNLIEASKKQREKSHAEVERYISIMKNFNLQDNTDKALWNTINRSIDFEKNQIDNYDKELDSLWGNQNKEHLEYAQKCMDTFFEISALLPDAILAIRNEFDLEISPDEYLDIHNGNIEKGKKLFNEFFQQVPNA